MQEAYKKVPTQQSEILSATQHKQHGCWVLSGLTIHVQCGMATIKGLDHYCRSAKQSDWGLPL